MKNMLARHGDGSIPAVDDRLCARCREIDFGLFFSIPSDTLDDKGLTVLDLGPIPPPSEKPACELCNLFVSMIHSSRRRVYPDFEQETPVWHLRVFSCFGQLVIPYTQEWRTKRLPVVCSTVAGTSTKPLLDDETGWYSPSLVPSRPDCPKTQASEEFHFHARSIQPDQVNFELLKSLIKQCEETHPIWTSAYGGPAVKSRPRWLIHCKSRTVVENGDRNTRYAALSYVWGTKIQAQLSTITKPTMQLDDDLPQTIEDALTAVLNLGLEYLWVDSCCIKQNSIEDVKTEIGSMAGIFSGATVTLVSLGTDAATGLPGIYSARPEQMTVRAAGCLVSPILPDLSTYIRDSKWRTRGWTYQEHFLSTCCLFFTSTEVFHLCSQGITTESLCRPNPSIIPAAGNMLGHGLRSSVLTTQWSSPIVEPGVVFDPDFMLQLKDYSSRQLTFEGDAIDAFRGVLSTLDKPSYYGIPVWDSNKLVPRRVEIGFLYGLLWYVNPPPGSPLPERKREAFPSWSWASTPCRIGYLSSQMMFDATILDFAAPVSVEDQNGHLAEIETVLADSSPEPPTTPQTHRTVTERSRYLVFKSYTTTWRRIS
ncbi:hypothetical protein CLAIMM_04051 [Cladophialophora immunda]|nr:hypothetical protein CLAIMM_04051 [Cladophialophora immunda]